MKLTVIYDGTVILAVMEKSNTEIISTDSTSDVATGTKENLLLMFTALGADVTALQDYVVNV
ncbi:hypothetical protein [Epilithonimonas arachidiradicis]|uniref:Uncharacterized protein n=1 Tax=Epilithonimonas arachidiradicis TaxID=1617282 RepID=A0A420DDY6_9FLAO|nr:hypothetical protein [Epilithonimonas arachidiradicis]RKE89993.1 hypothetical protein BXY58_0578 [Epilithonimonas arachidiradicis]GGG46897.1 hypothetical protein GCM10007332_05530 [Epilithonimonas arachidiradicis]